MFNVYKCGLTKLQALVSRSDHHTYTYMRKANALISLETAVHKVNDRSMHQLALLRWRRLVKWQATLCLKTTRKEMAVVYFNAPPQHCVARNEENDVKTCQLLNLHTVCPDVSEKSPAFILNFHCLSYTLFPSPVVVIGQFTSKPSYMADIFFHCINSAFNWKKNQQPCIWRRFVSLNVGTKEKTTWCKSLKEYHTRSLNDSRRGNLKTYTE